MKQKPQRNWSHYNHRLKSHSRVEVFVSPECRNGWNYVGLRKPGGKRLYSEAAVEACLLLREQFKLGLRQTEGFVQSLLELAGSVLKAPDYTTLSRRCGGLTPHLAPSHGNGPLVIAVDSTGLSLYRASAWNRLKHQAGEKKWNARWRKLHIAIDTESGMIVSAAYSTATTNDCLVLPSLLEAVPQPIRAVAADMAYDKGRCRAAIYARGAEQRIPPRKDACLSQYSHKLKPYAYAMQSRDDAIAFFRHNAINGDTSLARATWKKYIGYHVRSRVETTFSQLKTHASDHLSNRSEPNRKTQALLKCKLLNTLAAL